MLLLQVTTVKQDNQALQTMIDSLKNMGYNENVKSKVKENSGQTTEPVVYPIKQANKYIRFWTNIEQKKQQALQQAL